MTPVPESEILVGELLALLVTEMLPVRVPAPVGAKLVLMLVLIPGFRVNGNEDPVNVNPAPVTVAREIVTLLVPLFLIITVFVLRLPTVTSPKLSEPGLKLSDVTAAAFWATQETMMKIKAIKENWVRRTLPEPTQRLLRRISLFGQIRTELMPH